VEAGTNKLYYGDNLDVLRQHIAPASVDLIYLDPPFNSNRTYNVLFRNRSGAAAQAQIEAFDDTWTWSQDTEHQYLELLTTAPQRIADAMVAMRGLLGDNDVLAYLVMMAARLVELRRVLKPTGSLYLHCDPTASAYLKVLLDATFGPDRFINEVIWKRTTAHNSAKRYGPVHDVILFYSKSPTFTWNDQSQPYDDDYVAAKYRHIDERGRYMLDNLTGPGVRKGDSGLPWRHFDPTTIGRHWQPASYCYSKYQQVTGQDLAQFPLIERLDELERVGLIEWAKKVGGRPRYKRYLDDTSGMALQDVWGDIDPINARASERLGYPTQKPVALMQRILASSSNPGDIVLDPFCGCGTTIDAAQRLDRRWIGIDVTFLAIDLIDTRLRDTYGAEAAASYEIVGIPRDAEGAAALFVRNPFDFERWAVSLVDGTPNEKQVGDKGIDGVVRFHTGGDISTAGRALVSVKGGKTVNPGMVRDLVGTIEQHRADMGLFICMTEPTAGMSEVARRSGDYIWPVDRRRYPKVQILTIAELLAGTQPKMPTAYMPYLQAQRYALAHPSLF